MDTITTLRDKGTELEHDDVDDNFEILKSITTISIINPIATDDNSKGVIANKSLWFNLTSQLWFKCTNHTIGGATWSELSKNIPTIEANKVLAGNGAGNGLEFKDYILHETSVLDDITTLEHYEKGYRNISSFPFSHTMSSQGKYIIQIGISSIMSTDVLTYAMNYNSGWEQRLIPEATFSQRWDSNNSGTWANVNFNLATGTVTVNSGFSWGNTGYVLKIIKVI